MKNIIIIGNSAAGIAAAEAIRDKDKASSITIISDEDYTAYCRCVLSYYLSKESEEERLIYRTQDFYKENNINLILGKRVSRVEPKKNTIILEDNQKIEYDYLLIATGSSPKFPDIKGMHKRGIFGLRTIKDAKEILGMLAVTKTVCVLGGGLIGLKAAHALKKRGVDVKVIVKSKQILSQILDKRAADIMQKHLESNGMEILTGLDAAELLGNGDLKAIKLDSGKVIGCEIAIIGKGVSPNTGIVKNTDIKVNAGISVDSRLKTTVDNVFAAGDCVEAYDFVLEKPQVNALWPNAVEQGCLAARNLLGENLVYAGSIGMNSVEFFELPVISMGITKEGEGMEVISSLGQNNNIYKKIVLKDNCIKGVILLGKIENSGLYLELIRKKVNVSSLKEDLLNDSFNYAKIMDLLGTKERIYLCASGGSDV
ncbi:MAG TPA: FAD-dependent oxidoreductase [Candidatus Omnitrophota bacterium]|nr:FAD-dependent oxidoreductase [Candidatus Omnitrophota bacterium]